MSYRLVLLSLIMNARLLFVVLIMAFFACSENKPWNTSVENTELDSLLINGIGVMNQMDFDSAQTLFSRLIIEAEDARSSRHAILGYLNLGNLYQYFGLDEEALENYLTSIELAEESGDDRFTHSIYNNLGIFYSKNGAHEKAVYYFEKALEYNREIGRLETVATNLVNLGTSLDLVGRDDEAEDNFEEAISIFISIIDSTSLSAAYNNLGNYHYDNQDGAEAKAHYLKALEYVTETSPSYYRWEYCLNLAKVFRDEGKLDSARSYLQDALKGFEHFNKVENQIKAQRMLAEIERNLGNESAAISLLTQNLDLQDSILANKTSQWVSDREMNFEFGKKEQELENLQTKLEQRRTITLLGSVLGLFVILLIAISTRARWKVLKQRTELLENEKEISRLATEKRESEQKRLKEEMASRESLLKIEREKLQQEVDFKNRELVGKVINLSSQQEQFSRLKEVLEKGETHTKENLQQTVKNALSLLRTSSSNADDWENFKLHFEEVHPIFFENMRKKGIQLSAGEEKMAAYLVLNLSSKEIAKISSISPDSVRKRKQRLREKFDLDGTSDLRDHLLQFLES